VAGKPLQEHYRDALLKVSRRLRDHTGMLGIELMNEPTPGSTFSPDFEREQLWPFERRMIRALRRDGERRMIWFGPSVLRDVLDRDPAEVERFSRDRNLVYAPHIYTGVFNSGDEPELEASYAAAVEEARAYEAALVDAEWGGGSDEKAERMREANLDLQDDLLVGSGFWMWKQRSGFYNWHTVEEDGGIRDDSQRAQQLSRPHVNRVPGRLVATSFDRGVLTARVRSRGGWAELWSGTVVLRGGETTPDAPLIQASVDGRAVRARADRAGYRTHVSGLLGYDVRVRVPRGVHEIELAPKPGSARAGR
jgi:hypothetical protein